MGMSSRVLDERRHYRINLMGSEALCGITKADYLTRNLKEVSCRECREEAQAPTPAREKTITWGEIADKLGLIRDELDCTMYEEDQIHGPHFITTSSYETRVCLGISQL